jgi:hypothetical protein
MMCLLVLGGFLGPWLIGGTPAALAATSVDAAAQALRQDPVYVDPAAQQTLAPADAARLRDEIRRSGKPIFVAILPSSALTEVNATANQLPMVLGNRVGLPGTYAVVVGNSFRANSNVLPAATVDSLATAAFQQHSQQGVAAVLDDFVTRVAAVPSGGSTAPAPSSSPSRSSSSSGAIVLGVVLGLIALGVIGGLLLARRSRRRVSGELEETKAALRSQIQTLADDVVNLEPQVAVHPEARLDFDTAVSRYRAAEGALGSVRSPVGVEQVKRLVDEGEYSMSRVRARAEGREPPPPPPNLASPGRSGEPAVVLNDQGNPEYQGHAGRWQRGSWLPAAAGGVLGGLLLGRIFGGGWGGGWGGGGWGWGGGWGDDDDRGDGGFGDGGGDGGFGDGGGGGWGDGGGGGDWGGGGGGDFGGGGGGGDFGG